VTGRPFRVIDTGLRGGRANIAFDQVLVDLHGQGRMRDTIRFLHFTPSVLVGRHQALSQEIRVDACRAQDIDIGRRITGGGSLYLDEGQMGWELVFHRGTLGITSLGELTQAICEAAALGLSKLGIDARYRPRNDIEVGGRKLCGTGGFFAGETLFFQGTVLVDMDAEKMVSLLNIPDAKKAKHVALSAAQRVVTLRELFDGKTPSKDEVKQALLAGFAERLGITADVEDVTAVEEDRAVIAFNTEIGTDDFVFEIDRPAAEAGILAGQHTGKGGTIAAYLRLEGPSPGRIREVVITGDFFVTPPRVILDLEAALRGVEVGRVASAISDFLAHTQVGLLSATPKDFQIALSDALAKA
jgi:lipoate-protein ligase A